MRSSSNAVVMLCVVTKDFLFTSVLRSGFWKAVILMRCHSGQLLTSPNNETSVIMYSLSYHSKSRFGKFLSGVGQLVSKGMRFSSKDPYLQWVIAWSWERWASWWTEIKGERMQHTLTTHLFCTIFNLFAQTHTYKPRRHNWQIKRPLL